MKPTVYLLLFRGVGGATQLPVKPLREKLAEAGFTRVATYINSGNAVVRCQWTRRTVLAKVTALCREHFGFEKAIFAPTLEEWEDAVAANPFVAAAETAPTSVHLAWLAAAPSPEAVQRLRNHAGPGEAIEIRGPAAFLHTPRGFGTSKLAAKFDTGIGVTNTARNWNTVRRMLELARKAAS